MTITTNGWDAVIAANQFTLNNMIAYGFSQGVFPSNLQISDEILPNYFVNIDATLSTPSISALPEGQRTVAVTFPIASGTMEVGGEDFDIAGIEFVVKMALLYVESDVVPAAGCNYDLTIDFTSESAFVAVELDNLPPALEDFRAALESGLRTALREQSGKPFIIATVNLDAFNGDHPEFVPTLADYTFTLNEDDNDLSIFGILILTINETIGEPVLSTELAPANEQSVALLSNEILMTYLIRDSVAEALSLPTSAFRIEDAENGLAVRNNGDVQLESIDYTPTLKDLNIRVSNGQLEFTMEVKATVSEGINLSYSINATYAFQIENEGATQTVTLEQTSYNEDHSTEIEWWVWVVGIVLAPIILPILGIWGPIMAAVIIATIQAITNAVAPEIGSSGLPLVAASVKWNYTDVLSLDNVSLPCPLRVDASLLLPES